MRDLRVVKKQHIIFLPRKYSGFLCNKPFGSFGALSNTSGPRTTAVEAKMIFEHLALGKSAQGSGSRYQPFLPLCAAFCAAGFGQAPHW